MELTELKKDEYSKAVQLADLAREIWTEHYTPIIGSEQVDYMLEKFQSAGKILSDIDDKGYRYFIACDGSRFAGYCAVKMEKETGGLFLSKLYVHKSCRGQGISRLFMEKLLEIVKENRLDHIWLTVNKHNQNTIKIYKKMGFAIIADIIADIGCGYVMDDYKMRMECSG